MLINYILKLIDSILTLSKNIVYIYLKKIGSITQKYEKRESEAKYKTLKKKKGKKKIVKKKPIRGDG